MRIVVINEERSPFEFSQVESEFLELEKIASGCKSILEIGSLYGGSAKRLAEAMPKGSRLVCIDLGYESLKPDWNPLAALIGRLQSIPDRDIHLILGDSKDARVIDEARKLGPFDLVFIDGDHEYEGVASDWNNYGPMGKTVAFHDIRSCAGVRVIWNQVKTGFPHREIIHGETAGIGVLYRQ